MTLGNNADVLLSLKARSGENFQGEFKDRSPCATCMYFKRFPLPSIFLFLPQQKYKGNRRKENVSG